MTSYKTIKLFLGFAIAASANSFGQKPKIPHAHHALQGGTVVMAGDDHFEIRRNPAGKSLEIFATDKFREPVEAEKFNFQIAMVADGKRTPLAIEKQKQDPFAIIVPVPESVPANAQLEIRAPRITPVKGQVTTSSPQTVPFSKLNAKTADPHAGHKM